MLDAKILKLNMAGNPQAWIGLEEAATAKAKGQVIWTLGSVAKTLHGGWQGDGSRSFLDLPAIIAVEGRVKDKGVPRICNPMLFSRDQYTCLYCGGQFSRNQLSRDHVHPRSRGGRDCWENCVTSCKRCNHAKNDRTPEEAGLELLAVPFAPNLFEYFYLSNRNVLADQMDYLSARFSENLLH